MRRPRAKKTEAPADQQQQQQQQAAGPAVGAETAAAAAGDGEKKPRKTRSDAGKPRGTTARGAGTPPPDWESIYCAAGVIFYDVVGSDDADPPPDDATAPLPPLPAALRTARGGTGDGADTEPPGAAAAAAPAAPPPTAAEADGTQTAVPPRPPAGGGVRVLLVNQEGSGSAGKLGWSWMAGKRVRDEGPRATAAREVEEESHGLLPAALVAPVLADAPIVWWEGGKMVTFLVALRGAGELPRLFEAAVAAGRIDPEAESVNAAAWVPLWRVKASSMELMRRGVSRFSSKFSPELVDQAEADGHIFLRRFVPNILKQTGVVKRLAAISFGEQCAAGATAAGAPGQLWVQLAKAPDSGLPVFELATSSGGESSSSSSSSSSSGPVSSSVGGGGKGGRPAPSAKGGDGGTIDIDSSVAVSLPSAERSAAVAAELLAAVAADAALELDSPGSGGDDSSEDEAEGSNGGAAGQQQRQRSGGDAGSGSDREAPSLERWGELEAALRQLANAGKEA